MKRGIVKLSEISEKGSGSMIRKATKADVEQVQLLVFRASQFVFEKALNSEDYRQQIQLFAEFYQQSETKFSWENILVYEIDNCVVGCIVSYPAKEEATYIEKMTQLLANGYQFPAETIANTHYIDSLAVLPQYEGRGIATKLIQAVAESVEEPLSLLVEQEKPGVKAYYEHLGFEALELVVFFDTPMYPMVQLKKK